MKQFIQGSFPTYSLLIVIFLLFAAVSGISEGRVFWWTVSSSGEIIDRGSIKRGITLGQTAIGPVSGESLSAMYGFWNDMFDSLNVCIEIVEPLWVVGPTDLFQIISMLEEDVIAITNCGNCRLSLGLSFADDDGFGWSIGQAQGINRFVLRAQFSEDEEPPLLFHPVRDFIKETPTWATDLIFGPMGDNLMINRQLNLWLQFVAPELSSNYGEVRLTISLLAKPFLP
ncbi:MAG TPA: hypothetical protein ENN07_05770 [candidate division Zixibacteria bacterium]|nr:hypothetical protein [candidate division Zixibacteria bacterium]